MSMGVIFGVWDLFHIGHIKALKEAKKHCDTLMVCVLTDDAVKEYKRAPVMNQSERLYIVEACKYVDIAIICNRHKGFTHADIYFVSDRLKGLPLYCVPYECRERIMYIKYTEAISTTRIIAKVLAQHEKNS